MHFIITSSTTLPALQVPVVRVLLYNGCLNQYFCGMNLNSNSTCSVHSASSTSSSNSVYEPEYEPETISIRNDLSLEILSVVPPPLEYLSNLRTNNQEISGRQVWTGSLLLSCVWMHFIQQGDECKEINIDYLSQARILELGSGTGILGMFLSKLIIQNGQEDLVKNNDIKSNSCIVLTDGDDKAVELLKTNLFNINNNIDTNHVHALNLLWWDKKDTSLHCQKFLHSVQESYINTSEEVNNYSHDDNQQNNANDNTDTFVATNNDNLLFDCIVAGDVLYKKELPEKFFTTAYTLLKKIDIATNPTINVNQSSKLNIPCLWLCHIPRNGVTQEIVQNAATVIGFHYKIISFDSIQFLPNEYCPSDDLSRAVVYKMTIS